MGLDNTLAGWDDSSNALARRIRFLKLCAASASHFENFEQSYCRLACDFAMMTTTLEAARCTAAISRRTVSAECAQSIRLRTVSSLVLDEAGEERKNHHPCEVVWLGKEGGGKASRFVSSIARVSPLAVDSDRTLYQRTFPTGVRAVATSPKTAGAIGDAGVAAGPSSASAVANRELSHFDQWFGPLFESLFLRIKAKALELLAPAIALAPILRLGFASPKTRELAHDERPPSSEAIVGGKRHRSPSSQDKENCHPPSTDDSQEGAPPAVSPPAFAVSSPISVVGNAVMTTHIARHIQKAVTDRILRPGFASSFPPLAEEGRKLLFDLDCPGLETIGDKIMNVVVCDLLLEELPDQPDRVLNVLLGPLVTNETFLQLLHAAGVYKGKARGGDLPKYPGNAAEKWVAAYSQPHKLESPRAFRIATTTTWVRPIYRPIISAAFEVFAITEPTVAKRVDVELETKPEDPDVPAAKRSHAVFDNFDGEENKPVGAGRYQFLLKQQNKYSGHGEARTSVAAQPGAGTGQVPAPAFQTGLFTASHPLPPRPPPITGDAERLFSLR
ncbi:hypothetical protein C8J57DRAFT_1585065 [Mycena rebaudengoi]|nr:hypothetical protein C8J57DRAFT_1585065 [Mycena rebaudengoi]